MSSAKDKVESSSSRPPRLAKELRPIRTPTRQAKHFRDRKSTILRALGQSSFVNSSEFALLWIKPDGESECYASEAFQPRLSSWFPQPLLREAKQVALRAKRDLEHRRGWTDSQQDCLDEDDGDEDWHDGDDDDGQDLFAGVNPFAPTGAATRPAAAKRRQSSSQSLSVPLQPSTSLSLSPSSISPLSSLPVRSLAPSPSNRPALVPTTFTPSQLGAWYEMRFNDLMGKTGRVVAKQWIKAVEPQKQTLFAYIGGDKSKPSWWPDHVRHKEPDHLVGSERTMLLVRLLKIGNLAELELATAGVMHLVPPDKMSLLRDIYQVAKEERRAKDANGGECPASITVMLTPPPSHLAGGEEATPKRRGRRASTLTSTTGGAPAVRASPYPQPHRRSQSMVEGSEGVAPLVRRPSLIRSVGSGRSRASLESATEAEREREEFQEQVGKVKMEQRQRLQQRESHDEFKQQIGLQAPITLHAGRRQSASPHAGPTSARPEIDRRQSAPQPIRRQSLVHTSSYPAEGPVASPSMIRSRSRLAGIAEQAAIAAYGHPSNSAASPLSSRPHSATPEVNSRPNSAPKLHLEMQQPIQRQRHQAQHHHAVPHYAEQTLSRSSSMYDEYTHSPSYAHLDTAQYLSPALEPSPTLHLSGESGMQLAQQQYLQAAPSHAQSHQAMGQGMDQGYRGVTEVYQHHRLQQEPMHQVEQHQYANYAHQPPTPTFPLSSDSTPSLTYSSHSSASQESQWAPTSLSGSSHSLAAPSQFIYDAAPQPPQQYAPASHGQQGFAQYEQVGVYEQQGGQWDQQAYAGGEGVMWDGRAKQAFAPEQQNMYTH